MLNLLHLKYAIEIYKTHSISRAAENLLMGQPNLSRTIKDLETQLGITIFKRSARGMIPTARGEEFLNYAEKLLTRADEIENIFTERSSITQKFSVSVPRASYISHAFVNFSKQLNTSCKAEFLYKETNNIRAINNILKSDYRLGIIRYQNAFDAQYKQMLAEKGLEHTLITEFSYVLIMSKNSPLAQKDTLSNEDLKEYIELCHGDPYSLSIPITSVKKSSIGTETDKRIFVFERGSQFELLENVENTFMWVSPIPPDLLKKYNLVQRKCNFSTNIYRDVLIYKKDYKLSGLDKLFLDEVNDAKRQFITI